MANKVALFLGLTALALALSKGNAAASHCNCQNYLCLNNHQLYEAVTGGRTIGQCRIAVDTGRGACYLYANAAEKGDDGKFGYPKNNIEGQRVGTGCVKAPDLPKNVETCYFSDTRYGLPASTVNDFCTENGTDNAVAIIRHAIIHKKCGPCL